VNEIIREWRFDLIIKNISKLVLLLSAFLLSVFFLGNSNLFAASVIKKIKNKKIVVIDLGKQDGIRNRSKICFKSSSGRKLGCGVVVKAKKTSSYVRVKSKKRFRKIKRNATAYQPGGAKSGRSSGGKFLALRAQLQPAIVSQTVYNTFSYVPASQDTSTLWGTEGQRSSSISGSVGAFLNSIGLEAELLGLGIAGGVRVLRKFQKFGGDADFSLNEADASKYVEFFLESSFFGVYLDYYFIKPSSRKSGGIKLGAGIDFEQSTVIFDLQQKEDGSGAAVDLYHAESNLSVISLRLPAAYEYPITKSLGLNLGMTILLPLTGDTPEVTGGALDESLTTQYAGDNKAAAQQEDLILAMGHSKNSFGVEGVFGVYFAF
jgi:hypothetical protein